MKKLILLFLILGGCYYYFNRSGIHINQQPTLSAPSANASAVFKEPVQTNLSGNSWIPFGAGRLTYLAEYEVTARVMSRENYRVGKNSEISSLDFALGWGRMSDPAIYKKLNITQSGRFYHYSWPDYPPIPANEIATYSANTHLIAANPSVESKLGRVNEGDIVTLKGYLVKYREDVGNRWWEWGSSMTRSDTGSGACELLYVEHVLKL